MATQKNTRSNSTSNRSRSSSSQPRKTSSSSKRKTTNNTSRAPKTTSTSRPAKATKATEPTSTFADYWHYFSGTRFFRPVLTIAVILVLVLLDLLFSWNNYTRFFVLLGIELILAAIVWIAALAYNLGSDISGDDNSGS